MKKCIYLLLLMITLFTAGLFSAACNVDYPEPEEGTGLDQEPESKLLPFDHTQGFNFLFFSDTTAPADTTDYSALASLAQEAADPGYDPSFVLHGGDAVTDSSSSSHWAALREAWEPLEDLPAYVSWGDEDGSQLVAYFQVNDNGPAGEDNRFYSFIYENALFLVLDGIAMGLQREEYTSWLQTIASGFEGDWVIAVSHYSLYPALDSGADLDRAEAQRKIWEDVLLEAGVDLMLCGNQKLYSRTNPMSHNSAVTEEEGLTYVQVNSGGQFAAEDAAGSAYLAASNADTSNFCLINITDSALNLAALDAEGHILDLYTINK